MCFHPPKLPSKTKHNPLIQTHSSSPSTRVVYTPTRQPGTHKTSPIPAHITYRTTIKSKPAITITSTHPLPYPPSPPSPIPWAPSYSPPASRSASIRSRRERDRRRSSLWEQIEFIESLKQKLAPQNPNSAKERENEKEKEKQERINTEKELRSGLGALNSKLDEHLRKVELGEVAGKARAEGMKAVEEKYKAEKVERDREWERERERDRALLLGLGSGGIGLPMLTGSIPTNTNPYLGTGNGMMGGDTTQGFVLQYSQQPHYTSQFQSSPPNTNSNTIYHHHNHQHEHRYQHFPDSYTTPRSHQSSNHAANFPAYEPGYIIPDQYQYGIEAPSPIVIKNVVSKEKDRYDERGREREREKLDWYRGRLGDLEREREWRGRRRERSPSPYSRCFA